MHETASADLHAEQVLAGVAAQQRPLRGVPLNQVGRHRHLAGGHIHTQPLADAPAPHAASLWLVLILPVATAFKSGPSSVTLGIAPTGDQ